MTNRKVQTDIDRTLKEVVKGCDYFDEIHHKLLNADTQAKKEKSEDELKTQIKKLQRVRDQLKTWLATEEIREKDPLINARKNIESRMELFKRAEKESKTKAFSKEGLSQAEKLDPEMLIVVQCMQWVNDSLEKIRSQKELAGADLETLQQDTSASKGKGSKKSNLKEEMDNLQDRLKNHQFHIHNLEMILRGLDNGMIAAGDVNEIKESVEDYVQFNSEPDQIFDDEVYQDLDLDSKLGVIGKEVDGNAAPPVVTSLEDGKMAPLSSSSSSTAVAAAAAAAAKRKPAVKSEAAEAEERALDLKNKQDAQLKKEQERQRLINTREDAKKKRELDKKREEEETTTYQSSSSSAPAPLPSPPPLLQQSAPAQSTTTAAPALSPSPEASPLLPHAASSPVPPVWPVSTDVNQKLYLLEASLHYLPRTVDSERSKLYIPQNVLPQPLVREFPQAPRLESSMVFERMDLESLFFIFYHQPGTFQQFLAARELKRQDWRFHKTHLVWMQRYEDPTQATSEYELGTFVYFDPTLWEQKVRVNFTVEYKHLEL
ncbi:hypothetical protein BASA81_012399 [Batrachochytrium salamandrivorans]|nr:hypothetical protein BASA81_012399 [Batrachochytrium salamandrivorans]